jgi:hypothetical protein
MPGKRLRRIGGHDLLFILFCAAALLFRMGPPIVDPDLWHEMSLIREAKEIGHLPLEDRFSFAETLSPSVHHEWGAGAVAYRVTECFGGEGIVAARLTLALLLFGLLAAGAMYRKSGRGTLYLFLPLPLLLLDQAFSAVRAQMYSLVLLAVLLIFLEVDRRGGRWWILPWIPLHLAWLNLHAGFLYGLAVLAIWTVEEGLRGRKVAHLAVLGLLLVALVAANPYGGHYYSYLWRAVTMERPAIGEWAPLFGGEHSLRVALFLLSLAVAGYGVLKRGMRKSEGFLVVAAAAFFALRSSRMIFFYAVAWTFYIPSWLSGTAVGRSVEEAYGKRRVFFSSLWALGAFVLAAKLIAFQPLTLRVPGEFRSEWGRHVIYPVGAVDYLERQGFEGNVLVPFDWGAYLTWKLYPSVRVSIDGRYEVAYPEEVFDEQRRFFDGSGNREALLAKYAPDLVLTNRRLPVAEHLAGMEEWKEVYADKYWQVYARRESDLRREEHPGRAVDGLFP